MRFKICIIVLLIISLGETWAQQRLQVSRHGTRRTRVYEIFKYEVLEYKLKGEYKYKKHKIVHMQDSLILFENDSEIKLAQIKAIRLRKNVHLVQTMQAIFLGFGVGFVTLNTANNLITHETPVFSETAALVSAALLAGSFLIRELDLKRIRITKHKNLRIMDVDYRHLSNTGSD